MMIKIVSTSFKDYVKENIELEQQPGVIVWLYRGKVKKGESNSYKDWWMS